MPPPRAAILCTDAPRRMDRSRRSNLYVGFLLHAGRVITGLKRRVPSLWEILGLVACPVLVGSATRLNRNSVSNVRLPNLSGPTPFFLDPSLFSRRKVLHSRFSPPQRRRLWQLTKPRNAHIRFVRVRSLRRSIAARSARRWNKSRTWIASALTRSARVELNTRPTHSQRRRPTRRIRTPFIGVRSAVQIATAKVGPGARVSGNARERSPSMPNGLGD